MRFIAGVITTLLVIVAMPAFGVNHKDEEIRDIVAFVRHVPQLTDAERQALKTGAGLEEHHHEAGEEHHGEEAEEGHAHGEAGHGASPGPGASASAPPHH